jgi:hypothetical protein
MIILNTIRPIPVKIGHPLQPISHIYQHRRLNGLNKKNRNMKKNKNKKTHTFANFTFM